MDGRKVTERPPIDWPSTRPNGSLGTNEMWSLSAPAEDMDRQEAEEASEDEEERNGAEMGMGTKTRSEEPEVERSRISRTLKPVEQSRRRNAAWGRGVRASRAAC